MTDPANADVPPIRVRIDRMWLGLNQLPVAIGWFEELASGWQIDVRLHEFRFVPTGDHDVRAQLLDGRTLEARATLVSTADSQLTFRSAGAKA